MPEWIIQYWIEALFGLILFGFGIGFKKLTKKVKEQDAIKLGIQALLRDRIIQSYNHYQEKGHVPIYAMDNIEALYTQYHALGGNGTVTGLLEKLRDMPTETKKVR